MPFLSICCAAIMAIQAPPPSAGHSLVYADDLEMVLLVNAGLGSGSGAPPASAPTRLWGWDGARWQLLDSAGPPVRNLAGVAWDTRRHTLVMHGGTYDLGVSYGDTWEWTRRSGWRRFTGEGPGLRDHTAMAYDPERGRSVLFGGSGSDPNVAFPDTWEFDGVRWARVTDAGPPPRVHHVMEYDPVTRRVVVFGGNTPGVGGLGDTWSWDGTRWTAVGTATMPRSHARMVFHRRLDALLVVGGLGIPGPGFGMLTRAGTAWAPLSTPADPPPRYLPAVAYDVKRNLLVMFGGGNSAGHDLLADTWEFDGTAWRRR